MTRERRNWQWNKPDLSMYDYIQQRHEKNKLEKRHKPVFDLKMPEPTLTEDDVAVKAKSKLAERYM